MLLTGMKILTGSMHGAGMLVEHQRLNTGHHILLVSDRTDSQKLQTIDLNLAKDEMLSSSSGFQCRGEKDRFAYAVISPRAAKEQGTFHPARAWLVNEEAMKLEKVERVKSVSCSWKPEGESKYPF